MKPTILSWNVRGLNLEEERMKIKGLIGEWKVDIVCLQETELQQVTREIARSLWGCFHLVLHRVTRSFWRHFANVG
jgi:exonuclease III